MNQYNYTLEKDWEEFNITVSLVDGYVEDNSFYYEYGSIKGTHQGKPTIAEPHFEVIKYNSEILRYYSLDQIEEIVSADEAFISKYNDALIEELGERLLDSLLENCEKDNDYL